MADKKKEFKTPAQSPVVGIPAAKKPAKKPKK